MMDDLTPLNLEDQPKLFGLRYDQLIACLGGLILSTQMYSWTAPIPIAGGQDLRLYIAIFLCMIGPAYSLVTLHGSGSFWDSALSFYISPQVFIPGPDPRPVRFLVDETLPEFIDDDIIEIKEVQEE